MTGQQFRLPTESEWEFAARGGNKSRGYQYSGSNDINEVAWYGENSGDKILHIVGDSQNDFNKMLANRNETHDVATKQANEIGVYDMSGNFLEWCNDKDYSYDTNCRMSNADAIACLDFICRGGSHLSDSRSYRSSNRDINDILGKNCQIGFDLHSQINLLFNRIQLS